MLTRSWSRSTSFIAISPRATRWTSSSAPSVGRPRENGRAAATMRLCCGNALSSHQRAASGNDSSRSVSPVGAQSTMIASYSPASC